MSGPGERGAGARLVLTLGLVMVLVVMVGGLVAYSRRPSPFDLPEDAPGEQTAALPKPAPPAAQPAPEPEPEPSPPRTPKTTAPKPAKPAPAPRPTPKPAPPTKPAPAPAPEPPKPTIDLAGTTLLEAAARMAAEPEAENGWAHVLGLAAALRARLEKRAAEAPWGTAPCDPAEWLAPANARRLRHAGTTPPDRPARHAIVLIDGDLDVGDTIVNRSIVVVTGDLHVGAYVKESIVIVGGAAHVESYARDSILIALGGVRLGGYGRGSILGGPVREAGYLLDCALLDALDPSLAEKRTLVRGETAVAPGEATDALLRAVTAPAPLEPPR